jgi:lipopolysaccharide export system permease protein
MATIISEMLRDVTTIRNILIHHFLQLPKWFGKIFPLSCLSATMFSLNKLQNRNELMAMSLCGFTREQFLTLLFFWGFLIGSLQFLNSAYFAPYTKALQWKWMKEDARHFRDNEKKSATKSLFAEGKTWYQGTNSIASYAAYDRKKKELKHLSIFQFSPSKTKIQKIYLAKSAMYQKENMWLFSSLGIYTHLDDEQFPQFQWAGTTSLQMNERPQDFEQMELDSGQLTITHLEDYIQTMDKLGINTNEYKVHYYEYYASALSCPVFALLSCGSIFRPNRRGRSFGKNIFFIFLFNLLFWPSHYTFLALGLSGKIYPSLAPFMALALCGIFLVAYFMRMEKISQ